MTFEEIAALIEEPPHGQMYGRVIGAANGDRGVQELDARIVSALDMIGAREGEPRGYIVWTKAGGGGLVSDAVNQHTVLRGDQYVDEELLAALIEHELGCTIAEARAVYGRRGGGRCPGGLRPLRDRLDGVMAAIALSGGNLAELARRLGVPEQNLQRAARRGN
jgi:hypothetical protein